jgi:hypothetical protein
MLFHRQVNWHPRLDDKMPRGKWPLRYSPHALIESERDKYGKINLPNRIDLSTGYVFEAEERHEQKPLDKIAIRLHYNADFDIIFVGIPRGNWFNVKTVWLNRKSDNHQTLNAKAYR